jgi:hypothetical protein
MYEAAPPANVLASRKGEGKTKQDQTEHDSKEVAAPTDTTNSVKAATPQTN